MKITYNVEGKDRKELANAIGKLLGMEPIYRKAPTFAYDIGGYVVDKAGVLTTPEIWRMGEYLGDERLKRLAAVMYRSCFQLTDASGSLGEQIQQTNFAQQGEMSDVRKLRGGYSEKWTVFWLTAHFLNAAAQFTEMGILL